MIYAQVLTNFYITVNFQLRSSINAGLTDRYFYNRFCIETSAKVGFFGAGAKMLGWNPHSNAMTADLRRLETVPKLSNVTTFNDLQ